MSKDGYFGTGESQWMDPITLMKVKKVFEDKGLPHSAYVVQELYDNIKRQLDQHIKYSRTP
jgi:hypothetical protein